MIKRKIVLAGGCFDILHFGHVSFLSKAKGLGNYLVILLESDENTKKLKGYKRPIHTQKQRAEILQALKCVDEVITLPPFPDYSEIIHKIHPSIIAVTKKDPMITKKRKLAESIGAKIMIIDKIKTKSTTQIARLLEIE